MKAINKALLAGVMAALSATVCHAKEQTLAVVGGEPILFSEFRKQADGLMETYRERSPEMFKDPQNIKEFEKQVLDAMVDDILFQQAADKAKVKVRERELEDKVREIREGLAKQDNIKAGDEKAADEAFRKALKKEGLSVEQFKERIRKMLLTDKYLQDTLRPKVQFPPEEKRVKELFDTIKSVVAGSTDSLKKYQEMEQQAIYMFAQQVKAGTSARVRVRHIYFKAEKSLPLVDRSKAFSKAKDVKTQLDKGASFAELAKKYSDDKESAPQGGDIGYVFKGMGLPPEFEAAALSADVGKVVGPVESELGYHLIYVDEKRAAQEISYTEIKPELERFIAANDMRQERMKLAKELRSKASIQITWPKEDKKN